MCRSPSSVTPSACSRCWSTWSATPSSSLNRGKSLWWCSRCTARARPSSCAFAFAIPASVLPPTSRSACSSRSPRPTAPLPAALVARDWGWRFRNDWYPSWAEPSASKARLAPAANSRWCSRSLCSQAWPATSPPGPEARSAICASWSSTTTRPAATTWARRSPPGTGRPMAWPQARMRWSGYVHWPSAANSSMWSLPIGRCPKWTACARCRRFAHNSRGDPSPLSSWSVPMITARSCRPPRRQKWMPYWSSP
ncbi:hypothetical protein FQZ97_770790 [compost metagenome]